MTPEQMEALRRAQQRDVIARIKAAETGGEQTAQDAKTQPEKSFLQRVDDKVSGFLRPINDWQQGFSNRALESATFGVLGDEARAGLGAAFSPKSYDEALRDERQRDADFQDQNPVAALSADVTGGLIPAAFGVGAVTRAPNLLGRIGIGAGLGASAGATYGFMEGEGGLQSRLPSAGVGAGVGGVIGGAIPAVGALGRQSVRMVQGGRRSNAIGQSVGQDLGVSPEAGRVVSRLVGEGDDTTMRAALNRAGPDAMLADASPNMGGMLDATMRNPAPGAAIARQRVDARAGSAYDNVVDALTGGQQGPRMPPVTTQNRMGAAVRPRINPLYQTAYDTPINYATPQGQAVEDIISRTPKDVLRKAVQKAKDRMIYDGVPAEQIMATIGDNGEVVFSEMPNTMMADYIKRGLDEIAEGSKDAITGRMSPDGAFASRIARDLREAVKEAVPSYGDALNAASNDIRTRGAVRTGQSLLRAQTTVEEIAEAVSDATPAELRAMREGVLGQIEHIMGNVKAVASDQNIDARQAMKMYSELSSPNAQRKMQALFGNEWPTIQTQMDRAGAALGLRARVAGNSSTQPREAATQMVADEVAPGVLRSLQPINSVREVGQNILGSDPASVARLSQDVQAELAELLTRQGGQGEAALMSVVRALRANPVNPAAGDGVQRALTVGGFSAMPGATDRVRQSLIGTNPR